MNFQIIISSFFYYCQYYIIIIENISVSFLINNLIRIINNYLRGKAVY